MSMDREDGTRRVAVRGRFLIVEPPARLIYTWRWDGIFPLMPETTVIVEFSAVAGGTELSLRQEPLPMAVCAKHLSGWMVAFDRIGPVAGDALVRTDRSLNLLTGDRAS